MYVLLSMSCRAERRYTERTKNKQYLKLNDSKTNTVDMQNIGANKNAEKLSTT